MFHLNQTGISRANFRLARLCAGVRFALTAFALTAIATSGCSVSSSTTLDKQSILDQVDSALTVGDCATALTLISPLYDSIQSDNDIRMKTASVYACNAKVNFFKLSGDLATKGADGLAGAAMWKTASELFPSTVGSDYVVEGGVLSIDALQAALIPGAVVLPAYQVNSGGYNVGSVFSSDRITDANLYMVYTSLATVGGLLNRYGYPDTTTHLKTTSLDLTTLSRLTANSDGCALASSILNLMDSMKVAQTLLSGTLADSFSLATSTLSSIFDTACSMGCDGANHDNTTDPLIIQDPAQTSPANTLWVATGCSQVSCSACPYELRNRANCTGKSDVVTCAAAGLVNVINAGIVGWN